MILHIVHFHSGNYACTCIYIYIYIYIIYIYIYLFNFLNQALAWFLEITLVRTSVCVFVCVSAPQAMKNYSREIKPK